MSGTRQLTFEEILAITPVVPESEPLEPTPEGLAAQARIAALFADAVAGVEANRVDEASKREAQRRAELRQQLASVS